MSSFNRPGGNVTGVSTYTSELGPKRLELLRELVPKATKIAMLVNSENIADRQDAQDMEAAMQAAGLLLLTLEPKSRLNSSRHSSTLVSRAFRHCSSAPIHSSIAGTRNWLRSRRAMQCRPPTLGANMPRLAA